MKRAGRSLKPTRHLSHQQVSPIFFSSFHPNVQISSYPLIPNEKNTTLRLLRLLTYTELDLVVCQSVIPSVIDITWTRISLKLLKFLEQMRPVLEFDKLQYGCRYLGASLSSWNFMGNLWPFEFGLSSIFCFIFKYELCEKKWARTWVSVLWKKANLEYFGKMPDSAGLMWSDHLTNNNSQGTSGKR